MTAITNPTSPLRHRMVAAEGIQIHVVEAGSATNPAVLFLHGWPESWAAFEDLLPLMADTTHAIAIDLPGVGKSPTPPPANDKRTIARYVRGVIDALGLRDVTLVGHDVGGIIAYAYLRAYPGELRAVVLMNIAIPGVDPWNAVKNDKRIWHFSFHAVPELPEKLVSGREKTYFEWFYDILSATPTSLSARAREEFVKAYVTPESLKTGFDWYRAFPRDEQDAAAHADAPVQTPMLYVRGEKDMGAKADAYVEGMRAAGVRDVRGVSIPGAGHFAPSEAPKEVANALKSFMGLGD
jgi:pimeloyl-ACP methyl ester carboxylesterase